MRMLCLRWTPFYGFVLAYDDARGRAEPVYDDFLVGVRVFLYA